MVWVKINGRYTVVGNFTSIVLTLPIVQLSSELIESRAQAQPGVDPCQGKPKLVPTLNFKNQ